MKHVLTALIFVWALPTLNAMDSCLLDASSSASLDVSTRVLTTLLGIDEEHGENSHANRTAALALIKQAIWELQQGNLHLLDGIIGDNQCHLTALHIVELFNLHTQGALNLSIWALDGSMNPIVKYLALNLLHSAFAKHKKVALRDRIAWTHKLVGTQCTKKNMLCFLESPSILEAAKTELSLLTKIWIVQSLQLMNDKQLAQEIGQQISREQTELPVLPKYPGMELFLHMIHLGEVPLIIRAKTLTHDNGVRIHVLKTGADGRITAEAKPLVKDIPVIVIEGITIREEVINTMEVIWSFTDFMHLRNGCTHNLFYKGKQQPHHRCLMCTDLGESQEAHALVGLDANHILRTVSASFMCTLQPSAITLLNDSPLLRERFEKNLDAARKEGLCTENIHTFFIEHMYPCMHNAAIIRKRMLDCTPEEIIETLNAKLK